MKKTFLILFLTLSLTSSIDAKCLSKIELTKEATQKQLNKYNCNNIINNVTKEQKNIWHCTKKAPKRLGHFFIVIS